MTQLLFISLLVAMFGYWFGRCMKGFNPFKMLLGFIILLSISNLLIQYDHWAFTTAFIVGALYSFGNPLAWFGGAFSDLRLGYQLERARKQAEDELQQNVDDAADVLRSKSEELKRQQRLAEDELRRQKAQAEEELRKAAEQLAKERAAFHQQRQQSASNSNSHNEFDPYTELGITPDMSFAEMKKKYRAISNIYHPDKIVGGSGANTEKYQRIQRAWNVIKRRHG